MVEAPELRVLNGDVLLEKGGFAWEDGLALRLCRGQRLAIWREHHPLNGGLWRAFGLVDDSSLDMENGLFRRDLGRDDERAPVINVEGIGHHQADMAIDASPGIP